MTSLLLAWIDNAATTKSAFWIGKYSFPGNTLLTESTITVLYLGPVTKSGTKIFSLFFEHYVKVNLRYSVTEYFTKYFNFFLNIENNNFSCRFTGSTKYYSKHDFNRFSVCWQVPKFHAVL